MAYPIERFLHLEASSGILLLLSTILALMIANSDLRNFYQSFIQWSFSLDLGLLHLQMSLQEFVNDVLMTIFFFVVGLEIKRELAVGSLSTKKEALFPVSAAIGGMLIPALFYLYFNFSKESIVGWGIPMATDIAFALGVLSFISKKIPLTLKIFLLSLATIDDLGAIIIIATVYSSQISSVWLLLSLLTIFAIFSFRKLQIKNSLLYFTLGVLLWFFIHESGIHSTIAGVILGLLTPAKPSSLNEPSPAQSLIDQLHLWVSLIIMPIFAFVNSGIFLDSQFVFAHLVSSPVTQGVFVGLIIGKPLGIFITSWLSVKLKWTSLPKDVSYLDILGIGLLAGIGFTMAFFISNLSVGFNSQWHTYSKIAILSASLLAGVLGYMVLYFSNRRK